VVVPHLEEQTPKPNAQRLTRKTKNKMEEWKKKKLHTHSHNFGIIVNVSQPNLKVSTPNIRIGKTCTPQKKK